MASGQVFPLGYNLDTFEGPQLQQALIAGHHDFHSARYRAFQDAVIRFLGGGG
jgi:hypothetical protein